ncbi:cation diffusion facilitator family transporter [Gillisia sp. M10.2A]|uniref:Cation diffusion facilitator family transporter n=1 Tax=Gillisia lutea TaxID=2909668 RepID=A0ABS9EFR2_9FLAO|nr:cation diffusion facilitator family transporter [Gillisia lutea]MCF4101723.1 cation diffusion facilitator family transporter [Gillisia lutea]
MKNPASFELPRHLQPLLKKAQNLEKITIVYLISVIVLMYLVMGSSQAMKTAWLEDALSTLPAISFLIASTIFNRKPNSEFPYGYHRVFSIAFLAGALALFAMGCFLAIDSSLSLIKAEHPTIGSYNIFGSQIWMGWVMIAALVYSALPPVYLGYKKLPIAKKLHNKILYTDADTQKADYLTAFAAMAGIIGVGLGFWWADATAALFISFSVLKDGYSNLKNAIKDLMDRHPVHVESSEKDELVEELKNFVISWNWVSDVKVRFREHGEVYFGEVMVIAQPNTDIPHEIEKGLKALSNYHWKIYDVVIMPVKELPKHP